jgi:hypothetical protein
MVLALFAVVAAMADETPDSGLKTPRPDDAETSRLLNLIEDFQNRWDKAYEAKLSPLGVDAMEDKEKVNEAKVFIKEFWSEFEGKSADLGKRASYKTLSGVTEHLGLIHSGLGRKIQGKLYEKKCWRLTWEGTHKAERKRFKKQTGKVTMLLQTTKDEIKGKSGIKDLLDEAKEVIAVWKGKPPPGNLQE